MKSQDLLVALKIASLTTPVDGRLKLRTDGWRDWSRRYEDPGETTPDDFPPVAAVPLEAGEVPLSGMSVRGLADTTGISKSQVSLSLRHCTDIGLISVSKGASPSVNRRGLFEFVVYGAKYVFPVIQGVPTQGIATGVAAPVFAGKLFSGGGSAQVWPDAYGNTHGLAVAPLTSSVPHAVRQDALLYAMLALLDSLRLGSARERGVAEKELAEILRIKR